MVRCATIVFFAAVTMMCLQPASAQMWTQKGPNTFPTNSRQMGRVNCVAFHPVNPNVLFVGTPAGGVMRTTNGGTSWHPLYDTLPPSGVGDIVINPSDTNNIILGLGDQQQYGLTNMNSQSLVTNNYGGSWQRSSRILTRPLNQCGCYVTNRIVINPASPLNMTMATSAGLLISNNGGMSWGDPQLPRFQTEVPDIAIRHNDYTVQVACSKDISGRAIISRSMNSGQSWTDISAAFPLTITRATFATTAANANTMYALCSDRNGAFAGLFRSLDAGATWTQIGSTPNILALDIAGTGTTGSGNESIALVVSPTNANILYAGSKNIWKSMDAGTTWTLVSHFTYTNNRFVAADITRLVISNIGGVERLYACTGGGIFMSRDGAATWENLSENLQNAIVPSIAVHPQNDTLVIAATTRGVLRSVNGGGSWTQVSDSTAISVSIRSGGTVYMQTASGYLMRSNDSGQTFAVNISPPNPLPGSASIPYTFNPKNDRTIYAALRDTWKTIDGGITWERFNNQLSSSIRQFIVLDSDTNTILALTSDSRLWKSSNGGGEWNEIVMNTTYFKLAPVDRLIINPQNSNQMIAIMNIPYRTVFMTLNGGSVWIDITPPSPVLNGDQPMVYDAFFKTDNCGRSLIVATSQGIFKRTVNNTSDWTPIGMQSAVATFSAARSGRKLYAGTGRGIMVTTLNDIGVVPDFAADKTTICPGDIIQFNDRSQFDPIEWRWEFEGGRPAVANERNPSIQYLNSGPYSVKLVVRNNCGMDSVIRQMITVNPLQRAAIQVQRDDYCSTDTIIVTDATPGTGGIRNWSVTGATYSQRTANTIAIIPTGEGKISLDLTVNNVCGSSTVAKDIFIFNSPVRKTITNMNDILSVENTVGLRYQWYLGVNAITGATSYSHSPTVNGSYYVTISNQGGCIVRSDTVLFVKNTLTVEGDDPLSQLRIYPHPASTHVTLEIPGFENATLFTVRIVSLLGELIRTEFLTLQYGKTTLSLSGLAPGTYIVHVEGGNRKKSARLIKE